MISYFENLRQDEVEILYKAPILVAILIAGADDKIDNKEIKEAIDISKMKQNKSKSLLQEYYQEIGIDFEKNLLAEIESLPVTSEDRNPLIIKELERLNLIFRKIDRKFAIQFHESLKDIAKKIATASGGILGYGAINYAESKLVDLRMIRIPPKAKK